MKEAAPQEVAAPLRATLSEAGLRVIDPKGKPIVDLWLRKSAPAAPAQKPPPGVKLEAIAEGTFLGIARYHQKHYDFKNKPIPPGVYTLRSAVQPQDGDHLGVSETRDFAVLCPLADDTSLDPRPTKDLVKLSAKVSGTKHPVVVWIEVRSGPGKGPPTLVSEPEHEYQVLDFDLPLEGEKAKAARLGLVVVGSAPEA